MNRQEKGTKTLGVMIVKIGGAVATTAIAGIELLKQKMKIRDYASRPVICRATRSMQYDITYACERCEVEIYALA